MENSATRCSCNEELLLEGGSSPRSWS